MIQDLAVIGLVKMVISRHLGKSLITQSKLHKLLMDVEIVLLIKHLECTRYHYYVV